MATRDLHYTVQQRRESITLVSGEYYYLVTTVISDVADTVGGASIPSTGPTDVPYLSLFVLQNESGGTAVHLWDRDGGLMNGRIATPEDFTTGDGTFVGGINYLDLPRVFFPSATDPDPQSTTPPEVPKDLQLGDLTGPIGTPPLSDHPYYTSNVRVDIYKTVTDANIAADALRNAIQVFQTRYNTISSSFGTDDTSDVNNYRKYDY